MVQAKKETGLSPEKIEQIKAAQQRHAAKDPACLKLTPEEFINWHPPRGMSWEERARRMKAAGIVDPDLSEPVEESYTVTAAVSM